MLRLILALVVLACSCMGEVGVPAAERLEQMLLKSLSKEEAAQAAGLPLVDDVTFLRRVTIDLCARLPTAVEVDEALLAAGERERRLAGQPEPWEQMRARRALWVQRLLAEPAADEWRYRQLADTLRVQDEHWASWLRQAVREDRPWDDLLSEMLMAMGEPRSSAATGLLLRDRGDRLTTGIFLAGALLGRDLHCARCHDHPFSDEIQSSTYHWAACVPPAAAMAARAPLASSRVEYQGLLSGATPWGRRAAPAPAVLEAAPLLPAGARPALTLAPVLNLPAIKLPSNYYYRDHRPGELLAPRSLPAYDSFHRRLPAVSLPTRQAWVEWLVKDRRAELARVMALRLWLHLMGTAGQRSYFMDGDALEEPLLMRRNPRDCCASPRRPLNWLDDEGKLPLATQLAAELQRVGMSLRQMQGVICLTQAYHREARGENQLGRPMLAAQPTVRRLPAEVIWDVVTRWQVITASRSPDAGSQALPEVPRLGHPLRMLGCSLREWPDEAFSPVSHSLILWLANGEQTLHTVSKDSLLINEAALQDGARHLFLSILGRPPTAWEQDSATAAGVSLPDVAWALLQTTEFLFQH